MRTIITIWLAFLSFLLSIGQTPFDILCDVNSNWVRTSWHVSKQQFVFADHEDKIRFHLSEVTKYLESKNTRSLSKEQLGNRNKLIRDLKLYNQRGVYPINKYKNRLNPVFIDKSGNYCAVGYLMKQSGSDSLAIAISERENLAKVREIKTPGVLKWAHKNGFELEELALIQPSYEPPPSLNSIYKLRIDSSIIAKKAASYNEVTYLLTDDTLFKHYLSSQQFKINYIVAYDHSYGGIFSCNFPRTEIVPTDIAVSEGTLYVAVGKTLYYSDLVNNMHINFNIWDKTEYQDSIKQLISNKGKLLIDFGYYCYTNVMVSNAYKGFQELGYDQLMTDMYFPYVNPATGFYTIIGAAPISQEDCVFRSYNFTLDKWDYLTDYSGNWINSNFFIEGLTGHNHKLFSYSGNKYGGGLHIGYLDPFHEEIDPTQIFDMANYQKDWRINGLFSTRDRLFVYGKFKKSNMINKLEGTSILEITNLGGQYYSLPITTQFDEVYDVSMCGQKLILFTDKGIYSFIHSATSSIEQLATKNNTIYPNPVERGGIITFNSPNVKRIMLYDGMSRLISETEGNTCKIAVSQSTGLCTALIELKNGTTLTKKVFVK
jgi:hypothetical protein